MEEAIGLNPISEDAMSDGLTEKQKAKLSVPLESAITLLNKALETDDKVYGLAALEKLREVQRQAADYCENPSHDASPHPA